MRHLSAAGLIYERDAYADKDEADDVIASLPLEQRGESADYGIEELGEFHDVLTSQ
jgi:hypothetical protein